MADGAMRDMTPVEIIERAIRDSEIETADTGPGAPERCAASVVNALDAARWSIRRNVLPQPGLRGSTLAESPVALTISLTYTAPGGSKIVRHRSLTRRDLEESTWGLPTCAGAEARDLGLEIVRRIDELAAEGTEGTTVRDPIGLIDTLANRAPDPGSARWASQQPGYLPADPSPIDQVGPIPELCPGCGEERTDTPDDQWAREVESCSRVFHEPPDPSLHEQHAISDEALGRLVAAVKAEPDWLCDRCGMTADGLEETPLGWTRAWQQTASRFIDLCSGCTAAYVSFLDQPARERREIQARLDGRVRRLSAQIEADRANAGLMTLAEARAVTGDFKARSWLDRLLGRNR